MFMNKKIFISHSSKDGDICNILVNALVLSGISSEDIVFTSMYDTGVEFGKSIGETIKKELKNSSTIIFIITENFYNSAYCLNEMGAAWVLDKEFIPILLGNINYDDMQGFINKDYINIKVDKNGFDSFMEYLNKNFEIKFTSKNHFGKFIKEANKIVKNAISDNKEEVMVNDIGSFILGKNIKDCEMLLIKYIVDKNKYNLYSDWQEEIEIKNIIAWEQDNVLASYLSTEYVTAMDGLKARGYIACCKLTNGGNIKEFAVEEECKNILLNLSNDCQNKLSEIIERYSRND